MEIEVKINDKITEEEVVSLYHANEWSSAEKPDQLLPALRNSHTLVTARINGQLVGIGNAISDGHLVVYCLLLGGLKPPASAGSFEHEHVPLET